MDYDRLRELQEKFDGNPRRYFAPLANEYRKAGNAKRAIEICREHLAQMPGHMSGQVVYGQALFEGGEFDEARQVFEGALVLDPENLIALRSLGDLSLQAGSTQDARSWYSRLLDADPNDASLIALVNEIDASLGAPPAPTAAEMPVGDASTEASPATADFDGGEQQAPVVAESDVADSAYPQTFAEESPPVGPFGLERHYPDESATETTETPVETPVETVERTPVTEWRPPSGATAQQTAGGETGDPAVTGSSTEPFVNETMAQLYLQQGYRELALKVYRQLAQMRPADQSLRDRISEIESTAARETRSTPHARREDPPAIESPTPERVTPSVDTPSFDGTTIDSPPSSAPSQEPDSVESPARVEPGAEPEGIAARQPSIREFFATLGRRRPARASGTSDAQSFGGGGGDSSGGGGSLAAAGPSASLDAVFAGATVSSADSRAATALAGAFSATARGSSPPPPISNPTPRSNPRIQAQESEEDVAKFRAWLDGLTGE